MRYRQRKDVMVQIVGDEFVILDLVTNKLHRMNPIGALLWDALEQPHSLDALAQKIVEVWPQAEESATQDVATFLTSMQENNLVVQVEA